MSELLLNHKGLVQDTQATLREVAGILHELWDIQTEGTHGFGRPDFLGSSGSGKDQKNAMADTHQEVLALREGIVALRDLLPYAFLEADYRRTRENSLDGGGATSFEYPPFGAR